MNEVERQHNNLNQDWQRVDARVLGQLLAAQNLLFVLPDEARIAEFFSEALSKVPGITSCFVCLGKAVPVGAGGETCSECMALRKREGEILVMPPNFSCGWAAQQDFRVIPLNTAEHTFGFFIFQTDSSEVFEPYWPFLNNLANYVALSLENRMQKYLLEQVRDGLEEGVKKRTEELKQMNERFSLATRAASLGVWDWDLQKDELIWDDRMYELYGVKREDFVGAYEAWLQGIHPDDRTLSDEISKQARRGERPYDTEFRVVWPDNSIHYLKAYGQVVRDENGQPLRMTGINYDITDRKRAEHELINSELKLTRFIANLPAFFFTFRKSSDGVFQFPYASPGIKELYGLDPEDVREDMTPMHILAHPEDRSHIEASIDKAFQTLEPFSIEFRVCRPSMPERWLECRSIPVTDMDGSPLWHGIMLDITERKLAEVRLRESETRFRTFVDHAADAFFLHGEGGIILDVNRQACESLGYSRQELMEMTPFDFDAHNTPSFIDQMAARLAAGEVVGFDTWHRRKDGSVFPVEVRTRPLRQGEHNLAVSFARDITERKQMIEALAAQEREFRTLAENSPDNIARYDVNCRTIYVNPTLEKTLGLSASKMLGPTPAEAALINESAEYHEKVAQVLETGKEAEIDLVLPDEGEGVRFNNIRFVAERGTDGAITGVLAIGRDVTERKQAEKEIQQMNRELENRVVERTFQLEAANKELEAFAYSVSHDLRAPLRHIDGFLELLQKRNTGALDERSQHYMDTISDAAKRMGELIDDLLAFSRMGRCEMAKKPVDLGILVQEVIREYEPETQDRLVHWHIADLPTVTGDLAMLRAALANLVANALKFTRQRQAAEIEIGCLPNQDAETIIFVRDNGAGFDMAYANKLFGVFQRLHRVDEFEGSGIGLANVHRIIDRHGGRTWAEGQINQGATFYFSLPQSIQEI